MVDKKPMANSHQVGLLPAGNHEERNMLGQYWTVSSWGTITTNDDPNDKHLFEESEGFGSPYFACIQQTGDQVRRVDGLYVFVR